VTNLLDSGPGSLRQAIVDTPAGGTVDFQPGLVGTIALTSGELGIGKDLTIAGPGANALTISGNHASRVFDIAAGPNVAISGLTIADGTVSGSSFISGGGILNAGTLTITSCIIRSNSASNTSGGSVYGGGISNTGALTLTATTLSDNTVSAAVLAAGGGIGNAGTLAVNACTFSDNVADGTRGADGGGIYNSATLTVIDSTFAGNTARSSVDPEGGGIYNAGTTNIISSTLRQNTASGGLNGIGGGIRTQGAHASTDVWSTIIAGNTAASSLDVSGPLASKGHNLIGDGTGASGFDATDLVGTAAQPIDPMLGPLQDNGGPTQTMVPLAGSPAIGAGDQTNASDFDQRGFARIVGGKIDIGAFEMQPAGQATHWVTYDAPASMWAGTPFDITVTVLDDLGQPAAGYRGTLHFILYPANSTLDYTFTADDGGQHLFNHGGLPRARFDTVTGADTDNSLMGSHITFTVAPASPDHLVLTVSATITPGVPTAIIATVEDAYGNTVTNYTGTIHLTLTGPVDRTEDYSFTAQDMGSHIFDQLVFYQPGLYTLDGTDYADPAVSTTTAFTVLEPE
jgi:hypothetical protein